MAQTSVTNAFKNNWYYIVIAALLLLLTGVTVWGLNEKNKAANSKPMNHADMTVDDALYAHGIAPLTKNDASNRTETADELTYLIEEEKLAHDVYLAMYDKWGARVFNNIMNSEAMHQGMLLAVMKSRDLADPRKSEEGVFVNQELQSLYDKLITQGNQSLSEAYKVGVAIEERDIDDLKKTLAGLDPKDTDVKDVLDNLLASSENHLRAFNRQINR